MAPAPSNSISKCCDSGAVQETKAVDIPQQRCSSSQQLAQAIIGVSDPDDADASFVVN